jgi:hypothetical protein
LEILLTANSPGEVASWAKPVVRKIKEQDSTAKVTILLLPCPFASGREYEVACSIKGVDRVLKARETLSLIFSPNKIEFQHPVKLLHLGGDLLFSVILSLRLKSELWGYRWAQRHWDWRFKGYFARDEKNRQELLAKKIPDSRIHMAGDLLVDSVNFRVEKVQLTEKTKNLTVVFMPGSRLHELKGLVPLFAATAEKIQELIPDVQFFMPRSPFIDEKKLPEICPLEPIEEVSGKTVFYHDNNFVTENGTSIKIVDDSIKAMLEADFLISIPGTTTGEAGALGLPHYCILPLNKLEDIPYVGIIGLLGYIPFVGKRIKRSILRSLASKVGFVTLPNILANRRIIPEKVEYIDPDILFYGIKPYLEDPEKREEMKKDLMDLFLPYGGAAEIIAAKLLETSSDHSLSKDS